MATGKESTIIIDSFSDFDNNFAKKASLLAMLQQHQSNSYDLEQIALILGGVEKILYDYLSSNDIALNNDQLTQIGQVLTAKNPIKRTLQSMDEINNSQSITYTFNVNETYYHYLFDKATATKIVKTVSNIYLVAFTVFIASFNGLCAFILGNKLPYWYYTFSLIAQTYLIIHYILLLLTMNRKVFKKSLGHFVFWLKILTSVQQSICSLVLDYGFQHTESKLIVFFVKVWRIMQLNLVILMFSAIDCFQLSRKLKILLGFGFFVPLTVYAIHVTFLMEEEIISMSTIYFNSWLKVSVGSLFASATRVLYIFLCKQTVLLLLKKDKCTSIRYSPYIKWVTD